LAISKEKKAQLLETYVSLLGDSQAIVVVSSIGLTVAEVTQLRVKIRESGARFHVVKNTLFRRALTQAGKPVPDFVQGPLSVAFCVEDIAPVVKAINEFADDLGERPFEIRGGIVDADVLDSEGAKALADMPSKEVFFAQILSGIQAPSSQLVGVLSSALRETVTVLQAGAGRQLVNVLQARVDQLKESSAAA
jgi:large subunit ribosomal protein L10